MILGSLWAAHGLDNMASESQERLTEVGSMMTKTLPAALDLELMATHPEHHTEENDLVISNMTHKGKKRRRSHSGTARSKSLACYWGCSC